MGIFSVIPEADIHTIDTAILLLRSGSFPFNGTMKWYTSNQNEFISTAVFCRNHEKTNNHQKRLQIDPNITIDVSYEHKSYVADKVIGMSRQLIKRYVDSQQNI